MILRLALAWLLISPAWSQVAELKISAGNRRSSLRAVARNPDRVGHGPVEMAVYARPGSSWPWIPLQRWSFTRLPPGYKQSRDLFDDNSLLLRLFGWLGSYQARLVVQAPGLRGEARQEFQTVERRPAMP